MERWSIEKELEKMHKVQVKKIKRLKEQGISDEEIMNMCEFSMEAEEECSLPVSYLKPLSHGHKLTVEQFDTHSSPNHKWELYDGQPFSTNSRWRDRVLLGLLYNAGLKHLVEILPEESRNELIKIIDDIK